MSLVTAVVADASIPRGMYKDIRILLLDEEGQTDPFDMTGHEAILRLITSWTDPYALLEKEGSVVGAADLGRVRFSFEPDDTKDMVVRAYDAGVYVKETVSGEEWVAFRGKISIVPTVPEEEGD